MNLKHLLFAATTMILSTQSASADSCIHTDRIVGMADYILDNRFELPGLGRAAFGSDAAYLKLRYDTLDTTSGLQMLNDLKVSDRRPPRGYAELHAAYVLATNPEDSVLLDPSIPVEDIAILMAQTTVQRAVITHDGGQRFFEIINAAKQSDQENTRFLANPFNILSVASAVGDQTDEFRRNLATLAEENGFLIFAAGLLMEQDDLSHLQQFLRRHNTKQFHDFHPLQHATNYTLGLMSRERSLLELEGYAEGHRLPNPTFFITMQAALFETNPNWSNIYLNQTGLTKSVEFASNTALSAIDTGDLNPVKDAFGYAAYLYRALQFMDSSTEVWQTLDSINWPGQRFAHFTGSAVTSLDWMLALDVLGPFVRSEVDVLPRQPKQFSGSTDWSEWARIARAVEQDTWADDSSLNTAILIDLLWEKSEWDTAFQIAADQLPIKRKMAVARDYMRRMDLQCQQAVHFPGGALRFGGRPVYRFD